MVLVNVVDGRPDPSPLNVKSVKVIRGREVARKVLGMWGGVHAGELYGKIEHTIRTRLFKAGCIAGICQKSNDSAARMVNPISVEAYTCPCASPRLSENQTS
jgi:hypothetical protein